MTEIRYWCPTCRKLLIVKTDSPVVCGNPICAVCNGQIWRRSDEWIENERKHGRIPDEG